MSNYICHPCQFSGLEKYLSEKTNNYILDTKYSLIKKRCEDVLISRGFKKDLCIRMPNILILEKMELFII